MTKSNLKKYIIIAVVLIVLAAVLLYIFVLNKPKVEADVNTVVFPTTSCQRVGDKYYFISGKSVKCFSGGEEKTVYEGTEPYRICADEQHLFVCDSGIVCVELESGKSNTIVNAKNQDVWHMYADNGCLFYKIAREPLKCLDIKTDETKDAIELLNDKSEGFHKQRFSDDKWIIADNNKAVTYYNGKYLTYSTDDWKVTDEKKADEIKDGGKYTFEACGEYVFVFDDDTGECINRIKI